MKFVNPFASPNSVTSVAESKSLRCLFAAMLLAVLGMQFIHVLTAPTRGLSSFYKPLFPDLWGGVSIGIVLACYSATLHRFRRGIGFFCALYWCVGAYVVDAVYLAEGTFRGNSQIWDATLFSWMSASVEILAAPVAIAFRPVIAAAGSLWGTNAEFVSVFLSSMLVFALYHRKKDTTADLPFEASISMLLGMAQMWFFFIGD